MVFWGEFNYLPLLGLSIIQMPLLGSRLIICHWREVISSLFATFAYVASHRVMPMWKTTWTPPISPSPHLLLYLRQSFLHSSAPPVSFFSTSGRRFSTHQSKSALWGGWAGTGANARAWRNGGSPASAAWSWRAWWGHGSRQRVRSPLASNPWDERRWRRSTWRSPRGGTGSSSMTVCRRRQAGWRRGAGAPTARQARGRGGPASGRRTSARGTGTLGSRGGGETAAGCGEEGEGRG